MEIDDWKTFEKNNPVIALNILYVIYFKNNSMREKEIILSIIPNEEKEGWHYLALKKYLHYFIE